MPLAGKLELFDVAMKVRQRLVPGEAARNATIVHELIDRVDVAWAVWPDPAQPDGFAIGLIKGEDLLRAALAEQRVADLKMTAVPCGCEGHARALKQQFAARTRH